MGRNLLGVVGGHEVLMANGQREFGVGLEISEPVGIGVQWLPCLGTVLTNIIEELYLPDNGDRVPAPTVETGEEW